MRRKCGINTVSHTKYSICIFYSLSVVLEYMHCVFKGSEWARRPQWSSTKINPRKQNKKKKIFSVSHGPFKPSLFNLQHWYLRKKKRVEVNQGSRYQCFLRGSHPFILEWADGWMIQGWCDNSNLRRPWWFNLTDHRVSYHSVKMNNLVAISMI